MLYRLSNYLVSLVFLGCLAVVYNNIIAPRMAPAALDHVPIAPSKQFGSVETSLHDLFAEGAWQRGTCKRLQTSDGMLLFQNWEQTSVEQWKLWPLTVVIGRGMSADAEGDPVIIDAPQGADIKFTQSLDVMSNGAPPIKNGTMVGPVHIHRTNRQDHQKSFNLRTANVGIDTRKIWTTETIEMQIGSARMVGRDLTLNLAPGLTASSSESKTAILDRMELIYLDELVMPLTKRGIWTPTVDGTTQPGPDAMLSLRCGGRVVYDFAIDHLTLRDSVSLIHQTSGTMPDRFDCETLELKLNDPGNDTIVRDGPLDWIRQITATGQPAVVKLPSFDAELLGDRIEFNSQTGVVQASGAKGIRVRRGGIEASLAGLTYRFDPGQPDLIGEIIAPGAGIVKVDDTKIPLRKAQWLDGFRLRPVRMAKTEQLADGKLVTDVELWVDGQIQAWFSDGGQFKANSIEGILTPDTQPATKPTSESLTQSKPAEPKQTLAPKYFKIAGDVRIDTAAILAETQLMKLMFVDESDPQPESVQPADEPNPSPFRQWVAQPVDENGMVAPVARPRPKIIGNEINAQLRRNVAGLSAKQLSVTGAVEVTHEFETGGQTMQARMLGEQLQLIDGGGEDVLQLGSGVDAPARFELGDGYFVGPLIQVRPSDNLVWINAAGEFQMPSAALPTGMAGQQSQNVQWTQPPHCRWRGEMIFDGRKAVLSDGVEITAELNRDGQPTELRMTGDRLQVDLVSSVSIGDMQSVRNATVETITLMEAAGRPVMVQALQRASDGVLESKHLIHAKQLVLTPSGEGLLIGQGPGWYRGWMPPINNDGFFGKQTTANSGEDQDKELMGIHLVFNDSMQANLTTRNLDFLRGVRVGVRSVGSWDQVFDAMKMDSISLGESTLDCDRLRFNIEPGFAKSAASPPRGTVPTPWEMEATSGVVYRTRNEHGLLEGTASRAAYSSSKDLFTISGAPNQPAIFRQTKPDGSKGPEGAVRTIMIRPQTMKIENAVLERLNIAAPPTNPTR
jgi:hypothetical protein